MNRKKLCEAIVILSIVGMQCDYLWWDRVDFTQESVEPTVGGI